MSATWQHPTLRDINQKKPESCLTLCGETRTKALKYAACMRKHLCCLKALKALYFGLGSRRASVALREAAERRRPAAPVCSAIDVDVALLRDVAPTPYAATLPVGACSGMAAAPDMSGAPHQRLTLHVRLLLGLTPGARRTPRPTLRAVHALRSRVGRPDPAELARSAIIPRHAALGHDWGVAPAAHAADLAAWASRATTAIATSCDLQGDLKRHKTLRRLVGL